MIYGYCRTSTPKQKMERQVRNILAAYPSAKIVEEVYTGTRSTGRTKWETLLRVVRPGDTIVFDEVSRMSRNAEEGVAEYQTLYNLGVTLVFLKEPHINTEVYLDAIQHQVHITAETGDQATDAFVSAVVDALNKYALDLAAQQVALAFGQSEHEVQQLHQRTKEGIETARRAGKQIGAVRGKKLHVKKADAAKAVMLQHCKEFGGSLSDKECMKLAGISPNTFYKYKRELRAAPDWVDPNQISLF